ncbi:MAG: thioredoxin family protein [Melioribacteraceae bacterium]|nr:thioredoxin family protein [Melioribacteraceae bacterium]
MSNKFVLDVVKRTGTSVERNMEMISNKLESEEFTKHEKYVVTKLNYQRSSRILKTYSVNENLRNLVLQINEPQLWMIITEDWCGDSAQNIPYISKIAELNPMIDLKLISRDDNPDIMDLYLTDGQLKSIPKFVAFDMKGNELFQWGPRPKLAQEVVNKGKNEGLSKDEFLSKLHLYYADNKGKNLEDEFLILLNSLKTVLHS